MIREQIKIQTREQHDAVEKVSLSAEIMNGNLSLDQYKRLIIQNYSINSEFEAMWDQLPFDIPSGLQLNKRKKSEMLRSDLILLNLETPARLDLKFPIETFAGFMGVLYVFEGSTLGGRVILKQLENNPQLKEIEQFHFYTGYGDQTGQMWKGFLEVLQKIEEPEEMQDCIEAAQKSFDIIQSVFVEQGRSINS